MSAIIQQAFQQLRPPCVELSSVALKFRAKQTSIKTVLHALEKVRSVLTALSHGDALDSKLAEYAFFPLTHIFNEVQRLSPSCLKTAIDCVVILVSAGWRQQIAPDMGKQLLILMTLIASNGTEGSKEPPSDEVKVAAVDCIQTLVEQMIIASNGRALFNDVGLKNIVDQVVYMLLETISESDSDQVQFAAAKALQQILDVVSNRLLLASLLPRTASALTQVLKSSSKARRPRRVLVLYLQILSYMLRSVLADHVVSQDNISKPTDSTAMEESLPTLDASWLRATSTQIRLVLLQVLKLRNHEHAEVHKPLAELCLMLATDCYKSLTDSIPLAIDCILYVCESNDTALILEALRDLATIRPEIAEIIRSKALDLCSSIPREIQSNDDRLKLGRIRQLTATIRILSGIGHVNDDLLEHLTRSLLAVQQIQSPGKHNHSRITEHDSENLDLSRDNSSENLAISRWLPWTTVYGGDVSSSLERLLAVCASQHLSDRMARMAMYRFEGATTEDQVASAGLALACLQSQSDSQDFLDDIIEIGNGQVDLVQSRPFLVSELYAVILPYLQDDRTADDATIHHLKALAVQATVLQASQLGKEFRPELVDALYPVLALLGNEIRSLREQAIIGLDSLAKACQYESTSSMLIGNVDYLINAVALKLNSFDISPQAPQVILMMLRLCGARIVPYLDDLLGSIFSALDNFHGYPGLVALLFKVLKAVVEETRRMPEILLTNGAPVAENLNLSADTSALGDIVGDLRARKRRKVKHISSPHEIEIAPQQPWPSSDAGDDDDDDEDDENPSSTNVPRDEDLKSKLSRSHQLLLDIAKSASPHLASPSPQVRHLLLELVEEVSPLLARDENTFLPLINAIWPPIIARLLNLSEDPEDSDASYNICAAADTVTALCNGAGGFMSTRIDDIFPKLRKLFQQVARANPHRSTASDLSRTPLTIPESSVAPSSIRSTASQVRYALTRLLATILENVRVSGDVGDEIVEMLFPFMKVQGHGELERVLDGYNADTVWLLRQIDEGLTM